MKEPDTEGVAAHSGLESCGHACKGVSEALTGVRAGRVLSRENTEVPGADAVVSRRRRHRPSRNGEGWVDPAWSKTPSMYGNTLRENREIL
jgi:RNA-directed DNA polymerase